MQSSRFSHRDQILRTAIEPLEGRLFLSAAKATVIDLVDLTRLPKKTATSLTAAFATAYKDATSLAAKNGAATNISATKFTAFTLDFATIKQTLARAPMEFTVAARTPLTFALPMPDGTFGRFNVVEAPIVEPGLAKKFPDIKTYRGQGIDDPTATIRFDTTQLGFHAQVLSTKGAFYIDPYHLNDAAGTYASYYKRDMPKPAGVYTLDDDRAIAAAAKSTGTTRGATLRGFSLDALPYGSQLRTFRAAVAANGEYTQAVGGGTVAGGQAAVVTAMNRVNGVYETELAIRMTLVANNSSVIYTNPISDPYSNSGQALNQNTPNLNSVIGNANYDIGHVFTTGSGGVAFLGVVGNSALKGGGTTGLPFPTGDGFYIDYVAHEMGHQFGAEHTFNTSADPNRSPSHAFEPGSGSTIMGYAGITGDDMQAHSDPYFHFDSIDAIRAFVTNSIPGVGTTTATGNSAPTVNAGLSYKIPTGTPFVLSATGSDPNGDPLTYDWQERDLGPAILLSTPDNGSSPIIRTMIPSTSPSRTVPRLSNLLNNTFQPGEKLPAVARANFGWRVIARDNRSGGGGVASSDVTLQVINTGAAFAVTSPNSQVTWSGGQTKTITWNVAGTTANGIDTANVKISLSLDGGNTYPVALANSTANDGSEDIEVPFATGSTQARLKIEAIGNIFFDISNQDFTVINVPVSTAKTGKPLLTTGSDSGTSNTDGLTNLNNSSGKSLVFDVPNTINGSIVRVYSDGTLIGTGTGNGGTAQVTTNESATMADGLRTIVARQEAGGLPESADSNSLDITVDTVGPSLALPANFDLTPAHSVTFVFGEDVSAGITQLQGASLSLVNNTSGSPVASGSIAVSYNAGTQTAIYTFPGLSGGKLSDGSYTATSQATDAAGNTASAPGYNFVYAGGTGGHSYYVRRSSGAATDVEIYKDTAPDGSPDIVADYATLAKLQLEGSASNDTVTVDFINGNPIPAGFALFRFLGGAGNDTFNVTNPGLFYFDFDPLADSQNLTINVSAGATVELDGTRSHVAGINLDGGKMIIPDAGYIVLLAKSLTITNGGILDLNNNDMIIDYPSGGPSPLADIASYIFSARNGGPFTGTGLTSTNAKNATPKNTTLGLLESAEFKAIHGPAATFSFESFDTTSLLIKYTYYGDTDFNGLVDFDDYSRVDAGFNNNRTNWVNGDVDGNGIVDFDDYSLIDLAFNTQVGVL
ncbi:MAG: hypothetical protein H7Z14_09345 [Anaerolineae bacterium]|nr:hypothetical protein [Phycisphaerae bacterium]